MKIDSIIIRTKEMFPPLHGRDKYIAAVKVLYVVDESGRHKVSKNFQETYGQTEKEAEEIMQLQVCNRVKSQ